jgi:[ribosomal protein S18]-alanine N-acetyltransferase
VTVRSAVAADVEAVAALDSEVFGVDAWTPTQVEQELLGAHRRGWVAGPGVDGYVVVRTVDEVADLHRIAVRSERRRQGLARLLLTEASAGARDDGAARMLLEVSAVNAAALAFYAAEGFGEIDRRPRYYRDGSDAVVMERSLARPERGRRG